MREPPNYEKILEEFVAREILVQTVTRFQPARTSHFILSFFPFAWRRRAKA